MRKRNHKRFVDKDSVFWMDTYGFNISRMDEYISVFGKKEDS